MLRGRITVQTCVTKRGRWGLWLRLVQLVVFKIVDSHSQTNTGESPPNYSRYVPSSWKPPIRGCCNDSGVDTKGWRCLPNLPPCSVHVSASSSTCKGFLSLEKTVLCMFYAPLYQACILSFIAGTAHSVVRRWYRMEVFQFTQCKKDGNYSWGQIMLFLGSGEVRSHYVFGQTSSTMSILSQTVRRHQGKQVKMSQLLNRAEPAFLESIFGAPSRPQADSDAPKP